MNSKTPKECCSLIPRLLPSWKKKQRRKGKKKKLHSPAGNRTRVFRVTGGDTHHYTTEDWLLGLSCKNVWTVKHRKNAVASSLGSSLAKKEGREKKKLHSPAGNRTRVFRVTGGDTHHYTTEDWLLGLSHKNI